MRNILSILAIGTALWFLMSSVASSVLSKLSIDSASIRFGGINLSGIPITVPITVRNNSDVPVPIQGFDGVILYGEEAIAPVHIFDSKTLAAKNLTTIDVQSNISFTDLTADIIQIVKTKNFLNNLRLVGTLFFEGITIPIDQVIKII